MYALCYLVDKEKFPRYIYPHKKVIKQSGRQKIIESKGS